MSMPVDSSLSPHMSVCFPEYEDGSFLCLEEEVVLKDLPVLLSSLPFTAASHRILPIISEQAEVCSSEVQGLYSASCLPQFPQDFELPYVIYIILA